MPVCVQRTGRKEAIRRIPEAEWKKPTVGCNYEMAEGGYTVARTDQALRLVVKRELRRQPDLLAEDRSTTWWPAAGPSNRRVPSRS